MKILADEQIPFVKEAFDGIAEIVLCNGRSIVPANLKDIDVLLVRSVTTVNSRLLENSSIKLVGTATSGIDHIDIEYLQKNNIAFVSAHGSNARSVVEYVLSSLSVLGLLDAGSGNSPVFGIIGYGRIGSLLHQVLEYLDINCLINDPPLAENSSAYKFYDLEKIAKSDIISLHVPYTTTGKYPTHNLINEQFLNKLVPDITLINTARGGVVDENALKTFMRNHPDARLVLDVWDNEPAIDRELLQLSAIATPHIAGYAYDAKIRATKILYDAVCAYFNCDILWDGCVNLMRTTTRNIAINESQSLTEAIPLLIPGHYDVRSDAIALHRLKDIDAEQAKIEFDLLRKDYPVRREFSATTIRLSAQQSGFAARLQGIGFGVKL